MLKAVIFDMDGVIIDSHPAHREAWRVFLRNLGRTVSDAELDFVLDGRKRGEILCHFLGALSEDEIREYGEQKDKFFRQHSLEINLIPGVVELLSQLRNAAIATAVATSASENRTRRVLDQLQLARSFDIVVSGNDVVCGKPDPEIYRVTCQKLGTSPDCALAIEDAVSGIRAARAAGLMCIGLAGHQLPDVLRAAGATHVVRNFLDLSLTQLEEMVPGCAKSVRPSSSTPYPMISSS
jgi:beta-phosphoglucomutase